MRGSGAALVVVMNIGLFGFPLRALFFLAFSSVYLLMGAAYALTPTQIERKPILTSADSAPFDDYGISVALAGDIAMIGVPFDNGKGFNSGSVYLYTRSDGVWTLQQKLTASDAAPGDQYGWSVALEGDTAVVGARFDDEEGFNSGSVYIYTHSDGVWNEQQKLTASDGAEKDQYGTSVALAVDTVLIGSPFSDDNGTNSGIKTLFVVKAMLHLATNMAGPLPCKVIPRWLEHALTTKRVLIPAPFISTPTATEYGTSNKSSRPVMVRRKTNMAPQSPWR